MENKTDHGIDNMGCLRCDWSECLDLYKESKDSKDAGGELYVYSLLANKVLENIGSTDKDLRAYICDNGVFLNAVCFLSVPLYKEDKQYYLAPIVVQVTRDLKASIFLAFSGHYRSSLQVLRCAFENLIAGVKFQSDYLQIRLLCLEEDDEEILNKEYEKWMKDGWLRIRPTIRKFEKNKFLSKTEVTEWIELYSDLSRFIHTPEEFYNKVMHEEYVQLKGEITCPATTYYNESQLIEWSNYYQKVISIIIKILINYHPEVFKSESGELAIKNLLIPWLSTERAKKHIKVTDEILEYIKQFK